MRWQQRVDKEAQSPSRGGGGQLLVGEGLEASWSQGYQRAKSETPIPGAPLQMEASCPGKWNYR